MSILLVDDDEKKLLTLEAVLGDLGLNIVCARSGREALRALLSQSFALILLDVNMPGMDGFETASLIRQRQDSETTPIIFVTAYGDELFQQRGYSLGAVDFILAPIVPDVLRSKVSVFVELYRQTEQSRRQAARLQQRTAQLSALANQLTEAEHRERRRLAQILHDHLQQLLVAAKMRLSTARPMTDSEHLRQRLESVDRLIDESISTSRSLTVELSPPILHDGGLKRAFEWLSRKFQNDHGLRVHVETTSGDPRLPEHLLSFLYQAARELLFNVVKHAGVREAWLRIEQAAGTVRVSVEDHGPGFGDALTQRRSSGSDHFGLFSIRERLLFLNGSFEIEEPGGKGTRITMVVPVPAEQAAKGAPASAAPAPAGPPGEEPPARHAGPAPARADSAASDGDAIRVLLVDDHQILRKGLSGLLQAHADIRVVGEADDGEQAVQMASDLEPDVVVMDLAMPRMNGIEATRRIVEAIPGVQVIGLSMHDSSEMAGALCEAGAVSYLNKAGPPDQLITAIRAARASRAVVG